MRSTDRERELQEVYRARFSGKDDYRMRIWGALTPFFARWIPDTAVLLDLGAGYCEFINHARASVKYAMDLNPDVYSRASECVKVLQQDCSEDWQLPDGGLDTIFTSNFLEHLPDKTAVGATLMQAYRCLRPGGRIIAMGPNVRYLGGAYWDFFDHYVALTDRSLAEGLSSCGFEIETRVPRFLPYSISLGRQFPVVLLRLYLKMPVLWPLFGKQFLIVGRKPLNDSRDPVDGASIACSEARVVTFEES